MKIKKKIILSNVLMVSIPIICAVLIGFIGGKQIDSKYLYSLETMFEDENAVVSAQSTIYAFQEELWNTNWKQMEEEEVGHQDEDDNKEESNIKWSELKKQNNKLAQNYEMYNLGKQMEMMGYHFSVFMNGDCQYSNMGKEDSKTLEQVAGDVITHARSIVVGENETSIIKSTFEKDDMTCVIIAVNRGNTTQNNNGISYLKQYLIRFIVWFLVIVIGIIFITNIVLSGFILNCIVPPLKKLSKGTKRIREGDLDTEIGYKKEDEIGQVCSDFEKMRGYLKESALERIKYESYRRELVSGISHDLRTPLTSIKGYLEGLTMGIATDKKMQERYFQAMKTRTKDLESLVESLSIYNKLENHLQKDNLQKLDCKKFIEKYIYERKLEFEKESVHIEINAKENNYLVFIDSFQLIRVFDNLFSNTIKYRTKDQSVVFITLKCFKKYITCIYEDDGEGVPQESLDCLFDSFYRVDDSRNDSGKGSGLGLAIVKKIIEKQGGEIEAKNGASGLQIIIKIHKTEDAHEDFNC